MTPSGDPHRQRSAVFQTASLADPASIGKITHARSAQSQNSFDPLDLEKPATDNLQSLTQTVAAPASRVRPEATSDPLASLPQNACWRFFSVNRGPEPQTHASSSEAAPSRYAPRSNAFPGRTIEAGSASCDDKSASFWSANTIARRRSLRLTPVAPAPRHLRFGIISTPGHRQSCASE